MRVVVFAILLVSLSFTAFAQSSSAPALASAADLAKVVPSSYFFRGLNATTQARNSGAVKYADGFFVLAGLVDTSGYSSDIKAKYTGFFINEKPLTFGDKTLPPGEYGIGFNADGKFHVLDVAANELLTADVTKDTKMAHPVPLKFVVDNSEVRLYLGRNYVVIAAK